jgi:hypothetical protein
MLPKKVTNELRNIKSNAHRLIFRTDSVINIGDPSIQVIGMDCIWHNMDTTNADAFVTTRKWINDDVDAIVLRVARHLQMGLYTLVSLQVSKHSLVVMCNSRKALEELPDDAFHG